MNGLVHAHKDNSNATYLPAIDFKTIILNQFLQYRNWRQRLLKCFLSAQIFTLDLTLKIKIDRICNSVARSQAKLVSGETARNTYCLISSDLPKIKHMFCKKIMRKGTITEFVLHVQAGFCDYHVNKRSKIHHLLQ